MQVGSLVAWEVDLNRGRLDYGVVVGIARRVCNQDDLLWVKFLNGRHANKKRVLCNIDHLILVEDIKQKRT